MSKWQNLVKYSWVFCLYTLVPGCESVNTLDPQHQQRYAVFADRWQESETLNMLSYYHWLHQSNGETRLQEFERVASGQRPGAALKNQLRLSLLLSLPNAPFRDDRRAQNLLQAYLETGKLRREDDIAFAIFLLDVLNERELQMAVVGQLRDQLNDHRTVKDELSKERALRRKLQQQMKQLKAIEENLIKREHSKLLPLREEDSDNGKGQDPAGR